jgi:PAS domain S-box-containing protein
MADGHPSHGLTDRAKREADANGALIADMAGALRVQQQSDAYLRFATETGKMGTWELDLRTGELAASPLFKENLGLDRHRPVTWDELERAVHPEDGDRRRAAFARSVATGAEYDVEYRVLRRDGGTGWVHMRAQVTCAPDGTKLRMAGVSFDVTQRRHAELRMELSEESLRLAAEAGEVGTWDLDLTTGVLTWSDRTRAMFGISPQVPCSMADFYAGLHPDDFAATSAAFASAVDPAIRGTYDVEYRTIGKEDGVVRWVAAKGTGLFQDGRCRRAIGTAIDITARKLAAMRRDFLLELGDRLANLTEPRAIMDAAVQALGRHLGACRVGYGQVQPDDETVLLETCHAVGVQSLTGAFRLNSFGAHHIDRRRQGQTVVVEDVTSDPLNDQATWAAIETRSFVSVPLIRDGRFRASLFVNDRTPRAWCKEDVALIEDLRIWDALERARAEEALR